MLNFPSGISVGYTCYPRSPHTTEKWIYTISGSWSSSCCWSPSSDQKIKFVEMRVRTIWCWDDKWCEDCTGLRLVNFSTNENNIFDYLQNEEYIWQVVSKNYFMNYDYIFKYFFDIIKFSKLAWYWLTKPALEVDVDLQITEPCIAVSHRTRLTALRLLDLLQIKSRDRRREGYYFLFNCDLWSLTHGNCSRRW